MKLNEFFNALNDQEMLNVNGGYAPGDPHHFYDDGSSGGGGNYHTDDDGLVHHDSFVYTIYGQYNWSGGNGHTVF